MVHIINLLGHGHKRSQIACGIYVSVASRLIGDMDLKIAVDLGIYEAMKYYFSYERVVHNLIGRVVQILVDKSTWRIL